MKNLLKIYIVALFLVLTTSCEEEDLITDLTMIENELKSFVDANNISKCSIQMNNNGNWYYKQYESSFVIRNGTIIVTDQNENSSVDYSYNLNYLVEYYKNKSGHMVMTFSD
ncbi:hypothetical protein [Carboxylicivirga sp. N1Y90]|uniref:hypothetical protein n=1 Tax=Carboxylicivirga fragile TaxID=3417571 RepID=UPI003D336141|nr:hypothetical protein [Marinilabiliaceae bacterium N1Y90]